MKSYIVLISIAAIPVSDATQAHPGFDQEPAMEIVADAGVWKHEKWGYHIARDDPESAGLSGSRFSMKVARQPKENEEWKILDRVEYGWSVKGADNSKFIFADQGTKIAVKVRRGIGLQSRIYQATLSATMTYTAREKGSERQDACPAWQTAGIFFDNRAPVGVQLPDC